MTLQEKRERLASELTLGGPGLDAYAFQATLYCVDCGRQIIRNQCATGDLDAYLDNPEDIMLRHSETTPQPVFFGESDGPEYCDNCSCYLYGPEEDATE